MYSRRRELRAGRAPERLGRKRVLLIEAGGKPSNPFVAMIAQRAAEWIEAGEN
jgi:hypothetical protein